MFPDSAHFLAQILGDDGHEVRVVGGWVRDHLLGVKPKDLDLATTARPEAVIDICAHHGLTHTDSGLKHGTVGVIVDHAIYEITTLRIDVETDGRHAEVAFTTDWQQDALRRDFTINAMSMSLDGTLHDYFDGQQHLANRRVIFVGDATARIKEDYLRILRFFRFCSRMGDLETFWSIAGTIFENAAGLRQISGERIWLEMTRILSGDHVGSILHMMSCANLFPHIGIKTVHKHRAAITRLYTDNQITVLAALTPDNSVADIWKLSREERLLLHFLQGITRPVSLAEMKETAVEVGLKYAIELAAQQAGRDRNIGLLETIRSWEVPAFPVQGRDMIAEGMAPGRQIGETLRVLKQRWKDSDYQLGRDDLIATLYVED